MNIVARFYSTAQSLMLHLEGGSQTVMVGGVPTIQQAPAVPIEFKAHIYDAATEEEAKALRAHKALNILYTEVPLPQVVAKATGDSSLLPPPPPQQPKQSAPAAPKNPVYMPPPVPQGDLPPIDPATIDAQPLVGANPPVTPVIDVKSRNEALAYLMKDGGLSPEDAKKLKTKAEVIEFAKTKKITFPAWE